MLVVSGRDDAAHTKQAMMAPTMMIAPDEDDLFELDIDLLGRRLDHHDGDDDSDEDHHRRRCCSSSRFADVTRDDDDVRGHALLANCLLPVSAVSNAVPVVGGGGTSYPYAGYCGSGRLSTGSTGGSSKRFLFGRSARFGFSSIGFETMGTYFQRY